MPHVQMKVKPGGILTELASEHPDAELRFVASWPTGDGLIGIMEVEASTPEMVVEFIDKAPEIQSTEVLHREQQHVLIQFLMLTDPAPHHAALSSEILPQFPMIVRNGWIISETTISHDRLAQYKAELDAAGVTYEIISLTQSFDPTTLLTDRQRHFVTEAIERGYYDNPRECSLTDLAAALDVNKATASGILHHQQPSASGEQPDSSSLATSCRRTDHQGIHRRTSSMSPKPRTAPSPTARADLRTISTICYN